MKKLLTLAFTLVFFAATINLTAQDEKPAPSPFSKTEQRVGTTDITIEYSRPGKKGRTIYAKEGLVPYGKVWRTGANQVTKVTFSKDVEIEGEKLAAGSYALFSVPGEKSWEVHFKTFGQGSPNSYNDIESNLMVKVAPVDMGEMNVESFLIYIDKLRDDSATLMIVWDNTAVPVQMKVM